LNRNTGKWFDWLVQNGTDHDYFIVTKKDGLWQAMFYLFVDVEIVIQYQTKGKSLLEVIERCAYWKNIEITQSIQKDIQRIENSLRIAVHCKKFGWRINRTDISSGRIEKSFFSAFNNIRKIDKER